MGGDPVPQGIEAGSELRLSTVAMACAGDVGMALGGGCARMHPTTHFPKNNTAIAGIIAATGSNATAPRFRRLLPSPHLAYQKPPRL